jgi:hypothetical protein
MMAEFAETHAYLRAMCGEKRIVEVAWGGAGRGMPQCLRRSSVRALTAYKTAWQA